MTNDVKALFGVPSLPPSPAGPSRLVAGIDLGSTGLKLLVLDREGDEVLVEQLPTPWRSGAGGTAELDARNLLSAVETLLQRVSERLAETTSHRIDAIGVSGMGETGMVIDERGNAIAPAFAWFDPRGAEQVASFPASVRDAFAGRTGLPLGVQVTATKIAYLRDAGVPLAGTRWLNLPEFLAAALGGDIALEYSLTSRTGLLDQDRGVAWAEMLNALGVDESFLPPLRDAGKPWGRVSESYGPTFAGARLTVAGHDHLVAAQASGALESGNHHVSLGTAEVLLRVIDGPLGFDARQRLAEHLINEVRHVVPGKQVLVAGVKTGLLLRRVLQLAGINDRAGRDALDAAVMALPFEGDIAAGGIEATGARNDDGVLGLTLRTDGISPAEVFNAVLRHSNDEIQLLIDAMDREVPPAHATTLTGGWAGMASVQRARSRVLPNVTVSTRDQDTAYGAALTASRLLDHVSKQHPDHHRGDNRMSTLTTLERRAMQSISTADGHMLIVAADQRNGMKAAVKDAPSGSDAITRDELAEIKADLVRHLANNAPAVLLDPEVALPAIVDAGVLARSTALVVGMDASGFDTVDGLRYTRYVPGVSARTVRDLGGSVAKMLFYTRPDRQDADSRVAQEIRDLVTACDDEGLLLIVELLTYQLEDESDDEYTAKFASLVIDGAKLAVEAGAKVLKLQYPGSAEASAAVTAAAAGVPWAVLSAGVDHETFVVQVATAMANGASGAMAGRSLWKDSLSFDEASREDLLVHRALPRLHELRAAVDGSAA
ncbi:hypothetical protein GCM10027416_25220 [Okibacterium endophyticum]